MDMQGRIIKTFDNLTRAGALQFNTADLPNGIYFVVAQSENNLKLAEKLRAVRTSVLIIMISKNKDLKKVFI
jgi:hypothetical protein